MSRPSSVMPCGLALFFVQMFAAGQERLTPQQVNQRKPGDFSTLREGQAVIAGGQVSAPAFHFVAYTLLALQHDHSGIVLSVPPDDTRLDGYQPGDDLEVTGVIASTAGQPVVHPTFIHVTGRNKAPGPEDVPVNDLQNFNYLGRLVRTEGTVVETGDTTAGAYMLVESGGAPYKFFIPHSSRQPEASLAGHAIGERVQTVGVALQYCPTPPFNRWFELLVHEPNDIQVLASGWSMPPAIPSGILGLSLVLILFLWIRERRLRSQRERLRKIYQLGEEVLSASSWEAILQRTSSALPAILAVSRVTLYTYNRLAKALDAANPNGEDLVSIPLASPPGGTHSGAAACFHYRTLLVIPDIARSPFPVAAAGTPEPRPRSLLFVPLLAQGEVMGVLELDQYDRVRDFTADEQALAQHLGNQIGVAIRLLNQRSVQEQLFRTEKLAAVGRLISGVVNELQTPLSSLVDLAEMAQSKPHHCPAEREMQAISVEARKASGIVARLVSFAAEQVESRAVDVNELLRALIEFRELDWKASGIRVRDLTTREPLCVLGSQGQLEQVFLNLLVHSEQSLAEAPEKNIVVRTSLLAKRILIEISFTAPDGDIAPADTTTAVLAVTRSVVAGHGGEIRLVRTANSDPRFEIELPWTPRERPVAQMAIAAEPRQTGRPLTALIIEPDEGAERQLLTLLSARGYRVVPVNNSDTGLELAHRLRFDVTFCSVHSPGLNWVELSERLQARCGGFVLLSGGYDAELAADFEGDGRYVLPKPVQEAELDRILQWLESAAAMRVAEA